MRGDEDRVVAAFCAWLEHDGWAVQREIDFVDVLAERDGERLLAEAKGRTSSPCLDVDTMYGQLLRRMRRPRAGDRYAVVVPTQLLTAAVRVPTWLRQSLSIDIYEVTDTGVVRVLEGGHESHGSHGGDESGPDAAF